MTPSDLPHLRVPLIPLGSGFYRVIATEPYPPDLDRDAPMTLDELRASIRRANGQDLPISGTRWVSGSPTPAGRPRTTAPGACCWPATPRTFTCPRRTALDTRYDTQPTRTPSPAAGRPTWR